MSKYQPPFEMTETIAYLTAEIAELAGEISVYEGLTTNPTLRRENRIKTIQSKGISHDIPLLCRYSYCGLKSDSDVGKDIAWGIDEIQWSVGSEHAVGIALIIEDVVEINACCNIAIGVGK